MTTTADKLVTLAEAKQWLRERVDDGAPCPCCSQFAKVYQRKLNSSMAWALIRAYRVSNGGQDWIHVPTCGDLARLGGDWAKMAHWGLIEEKPEQKDDGNPHVGYWRLTKAGIDFVLGRASIQKYIFIYDHKKLNRPSPERVTIQEALGDKFDYSELMRLPSTPTDG